MFCKVFSLRPGVLHTVFVAFSLPQTLIKSLAKKLVNNLAKNLAKNSSDTLTENCFGDIIADIWRYFGRFLGGKNVENYRKKTLKIL